MANKNIYSRMQQKHDIQANWEKAVNFIPLEGEIIVYDPDENNLNSRIKIGDGKTKINDLLFIPSVKTSGGIVFQPEAPDDKTALWVDTDDDTADGISPTANVKQTEDGAIITVTDKNGTTTATIQNGKDGADGYTPVKGVDYYTDADKSEFSEYIASELAKRGQLAPEYANSIEECTDTSKMYVLPDGFIYAYTLTETEGGAGYTNLVPTSTDTDGSIYNGTGYKDNVRLSSSGGVSGTAQSNSSTTGFMPWQSKGVIRIKGAKFLRPSEGVHYYAVFYKEDKSVYYYFAASENGEYNDSFSFIKITEDDAGVTTIDLSAAPGGSTISDAVINSAFFRLTVVGSGANLIVTVNEEIEEAGSSISYAWTSTGHAFVPADYEDRIIALEEESAENKETVAELKQQVDDILDGTTEIVASTKFDPTVYDLPVLYLTGDTAPIAVSKDNKVTLSYVYGNRSGTCTLKGQGATSYKKAQALVNAGKAGKFNYTINFDTAFEAADGWGSQKKYCLKANWIDHSHSRNVVSAKLWGKIVKSRTTVNANLSGLVNGGAVDGFPIVIMLNGEFHGLYTFNIPKDGWMFGLVEDTTKQQAVVGANDHKPATQFKGEVAGDESDFELEFVSDETNTAWVNTSLNQLINACIDSWGGDLDTTVAQYLDWDSAIDYYILVCVLCGGDMVDKNYLLTTFDGTKWHFTAYDMDSTYGLEWNGSKLNRPVTNINFVSCAATNRVFELIKRFKTNALKARYSNLRADILSESRIVQTVENFVWAIPSPILTEDVKRYPTVPGSAVNTVDQIARWVRQRLETCDAWVNALPAQETPVEPDEPEEPSEGYTNLVPTSTDTDGSIYNGTGYKDDTRLSSSGGVSGTAQSGSVTTGFMPFRNTDIIRIKGVDLLTAKANHGGHYYFNLYDSNKTKIDGGVMDISAYATDFATQVSLTYDETTGVTTFQVIDPTSPVGYYRVAAQSAVYFRLNGYGKGADLIVTVNEEIV